MAQTAGKISVINQTSEIYIGNAGTGTITASGGSIVGSGIIAGNVNLTGDARIIANVIKTSTPECRNCWFGLGIYFGNYTTSQTSGLDVEVNVANTSEALLTVYNGTATLNGTLALTLFKGNIPPVGYSVAAVGAGGGITGTFDTLNLPALPNGETWSISYNPNSVVLTVEAPTVSAK